MTTAATSVAMMSALSLPEPGEEGTAPDWIHVLPSAGGRLKTVDGRGPYIVRDVNAIIEASMAEGDIPIDTDHAIGKAAKRGDPAPARGWITAMQAREDGVWAKVAWTKEGRDLVASRAYRKISPVIMHLRNGVITAIREVSLINRPNLRGLHALNSEGSDMLQEELIKLLGLKEGASEDDVLTAAQAALDKKGGDELTAMQSALDDLAEIVGLEAGAAPESIQTAAKALKASADGNSEKLVSMQSQLDTLTTDAKRTKSEAVVDQAMKDGHAIPAAQREEFVSMHMEMPERAEKIINGLPKLGETHTGQPAPAGEPTASAMSAEEIAGKAVAYQAEAAKQGRMVDTAQAVAAVLEEKA